MKFLYFLGSANFPYRVKTKSFQNGFSKMEKIVPQTVIRLFKLADFLPWFLWSISFCSRMGNSVLFWVLRQQFGYLLGFSKKIFYEHTYHFYIRSPPSFDIQIYSFKSENIPKIVLLTAIVLQSTNQMGISLHFLDQQ